jgi:hypothetical protein
MKSGSDIVKEGYSSVTGIRRLSAGDKVDVEPTGWLGKCADGMPAGGSVTQLDMEYGIILTRLPEGWKRAGFK